MVRDGDVVFNGSIWALFALSLMLVSCASPTVDTSVKYYKPALSAWDGVLMADSKENDLDARICFPSIEEPSPCVVMLSSDFFNYKRACSDYKQSSSLHAPEMDNN